MVVRVIRRSLLGLVGVAWLGATGGAWGQSAANMEALRGLLPVSVLGNTAEGRVALGANLAVTAAMQTGELRVPMLLPFGEQQGLALRDAFITGGNAAELADGLGTRLGGIYRERARYSDYKTFTSVTPGVAALIAYTNATTASDSNAGKYFFANATLDGKAPVSDAAAGLLAGVGGVTDVFGKAYGKPAGSAGGDAFGNPRPFQTAPRVLAIEGTDYFGAASSAAQHLSGPAQDLRDSPAFPSGHTTYGTMESLLLGLLVPERYPEMVVRAAEYGHNRVLLGAHYAMDVVAGRALAMHDVAHLLANDPAFVGGTRAGVTIGDYPAALLAARGELGAVLRQACGEAVAACAAHDDSRFTDLVASRGLLDATLGYGLPAVYPERVGKVAEVERVAPEAGLLLVAAYPYLSRGQANEILAATAGPGGGFLDDGTSALGVYARLDLFAAVRRAASMAPTN